MVLDRKFFAFLAVIALHGALSNTIGPFSNLIVKYRSGWPDKNVSTVLTAALLINFVFAICTPSLQRKLYHRRIYLGVYTALITVLLLLATDIGTMPFVLLFLSRGGMETMLKNMLDSVTYLTLDEEQKDIYSGARSLVKGAVGALTAILVGLLLDGMKIYAVFLMAAGLMITAVILFLCLIAPMFKNKSE